MPVFHRLAGATLAGLLALSAEAQAQTQPPPLLNVVGLSASASVEVTKDLLGVTFTTTREGSDAGVVQNQLKQALDAALAEARKVARPGQIDVRTGNFSLYPRYAPKGGITGWQGSAELVVEGRDSQGIAQLSGRVQTMNIARVGWSLSREAREKVEGDVAAQAIARFRSQADTFAKNFGFTGHVLREVQVSGNEQGGFVPVMRAQASKAMSDEALPVEAGKASVTATVSGTVQLTK
jgi:predicted secreted protein